ncbi:MAG: hypothetical protein KKD47_03250 [Proteobacteria bacterium]|nr:hypothetical protein [Pseudomonadota bacterium]
MKRIVDSLLISLTIAVSFVLLAATSQAAIKASLPTPRMASASAVVNGKIYIIGGFSKQGRSSAVVEEYDPSKDKWSQKASMPTSMGMTSAVAVGKTIYVIGGRNESGITNIVQAYDTQRNSWNNVKSMSTARWNHMVAVVGGHIYVFGGITGVGNRREAIDKGEIYDPAKDSWSNGASMPNAKQGAAIAVNQPKIYICGGRSGAGNSGYVTGSVDIFDTILKTWSSLSPMKKARTGSQASVVNGKLYVIGGAADGVATNSVEVYDIKSNTWGSQLTLQKPRTGHSVTSVENNIFVIGGAVEESLEGITGMVEELTINAEKKSIEPIKSASDVSEEQEDTKQATIETIKVKVSSKVLKAINSWNQKVWFFTSKSNPIKSLVGLKKDEVACWGVEHSERLFEFFNAAGIKYEDKSFHIIGTGNHIFDGMDNPPRLFITWSNYALDLKGAVRVIFVE